jgi:hypothetical protein
MYDTFEEYTHEALNGLNGGYVHGMQVGPYVARPCCLGIMDYDSFESYTNSAVLNGLYIPEWTDPFIDRVNHLGMIAYDTFEAYSNGADLIGLNLGWSSVYGGWEAPYSEQASVEALAWAPRRPWRSARLRMGRLTQSASTGTTSTSTSHTSLTSPWPS